MQWRIYYSDGSTYSSDDGSPASAPAFGVLCIVQPDELVGRVIMHGWGWFYWTGDEWWGSDIYGLLDRLLHRLPTEAICQGRNVSNAEFQATYRRVCEDPDFPAQSGHRPGFESPDTRLG